MFTGIVETTGTILACTSTAHGKRLSIDSRGWSYRPSRGDSVSVNGVCLTAVDPTDGTLNFDVIPQTLGITTLGHIQPGMRANLERAATMGSLLGGHVVQGHVDGTARVLTIDTNNQWRVTLELPPSIGIYCVPKGSIALDGVSLTLATVRAPRADGYVEIEVTLIPETLERTTLSGWKVGDHVNTEADATAKTIVHFLTHWKERH